MQTVLGKSGLFRPTDRDEHEPVQSTWLVSVCLSYGDDAEK